MKGNAKRTFVYQSKVDGKIYGDPHEWTPQQAGKINAQNRKDGAYGVWLDASMLTEKERNNRGSEADASLHFGSPCPTCGDKLAKALFAEQGNPKKIAFSESDLAGFINATIAWADKTAKEFER